MNFMLVLQCHVSAAQDSPSTTQERGKKRKRGEEGDADAMSEPIGGGCQQGVSLEMAGASLDELVRSASTFFRFCDGLQDVAVCVVP